MYFIHNILIKTFRPVIWPSTGWSKLHSCNRNITLKNGRITSRNMLLRILLIKHIINIKVYLLVIYIFLDAINARNGTY